MQSLDQRFTENVGSLIRTLHSAKVGSQLLPTHELEPLDSLVRRMNKDVQMYMERDGVPMLEGKLSVRIEQPKTLWQRIRTALK